MLHIRMSIFCHYIILFYEGGLITWCRFCHSFSFFLVFRARFDLLRRVEIKKGKTLRNFAIHRECSYVCYFFYKPRNTSASIKIRRHRVQLLKMNTLVKQICTLLLSCYVIYLFYQSLSLNLRTRIATVRMEYCRTKMFLAILFIIQLKASFLS